MGRFILPLLVTSLAFQGSGDIERSIARRWTDNVLAHQPGVVDRPLLDIAAQSADHLDIVRRRIRDLVKKTPTDRRNDILRRGALAHMDIALLMPERAADYVQSDDGRGQAFTFDAFETPRTTLYRREPDRLVFSLDGEFVDLGVETAHWAMARGLLRGVLPHAGSDEFVRLWYRAVTAHFEDAFLLGNARYHLRHALDVLPKDPIILFYAGALHEALASARIQSVPMTRRDLAGQLKFPSSREEWLEAERLLAAAVKEHGPPEATLRLARVRGRLGKHEDAAVMLRDIGPRLDEPALQYFGALFLGSEEAALGRADVARDSRPRSPGSRRPPFPGKRRPPPGCPSAQSRPGCATSPARSSIRRAPRVRVPPPESARRCAPPAA